MRHTSGTWHTDYNDVENIDNIVYSEKTTNGHSNIHFAVQGAASREEREAVARFIVAGPKILEALVELVDVAANMSALLNLQSDPAELVAARSVCEKFVDRKLAA